MANLSYYLGPWVWTVEDGMSYWSAPAGTVGQVDLRGIPTQGIAETLGDRPYGFFCVDPLSLLSTDYTLLGAGDCRDILTTSLTQDAWQSLLGYRPQGERLVDLLWDHLTNGSDPTGAEPVMPLLPTAAGQLELHLAGHSLVRSSRFQIFAAGPHADRVRTLLQRQYRAMHDAEQRGQLRSDHPRRVLDYWCEKYRLSKRDRAAWSRLVPSELRGGHPGPLPHETTITDDFDGANSATLGVDLTWTEFNNGWDNSSFHARRSIAAQTERRARADTALSSDDHYSQASIEVCAGTNSADLAQAGATCRLPTGTANTAYASFLMDRPTHADDNKQFLYKIVSGAFTLIGGGVAVTVALPDTIKIQADGSGIVDYWNGVATRSTVTDTAISGNLYCGLYGYIQTTSESAELDNFQAADLTTAITGDAAQTLASLTQSASGNILVQGDASQQLPSLSQSASGQAIVAGDAAQGLPSLSQAASGDVLVQGDTANALPSLSQSASGDVLVQGDVAQSLPSLTQSASGSQQITGDAAQSLPSLTQSASGGVIVQGEASQAVPSLSQSASGKALVQGDGGSLLRSIVQAATGDVPIAGSASQTLPSLTQSVAGPVAAVPDYFTPLRCALNHRAALRGQSGYVPPLRSSTGHLVPLRGDPTNDD